MNLKNKLLSGVVATATAFFVGVNVNTHSARATSINYNYALGYNQGSPYQTANKIIVAHETANPNATAENNAIFENNNWYTSGAYVQYIVGADNQGHHGRIFAVGAEGYQAWGAGSWANANAPVQIELAETYDKAGFKQDYATYVNLLRSSAKKYGIPTTFDSSAWTGIKSHNWISNNVWGDHTDPFGYLAKMGISRAQFKYDVEHGISNSNNVKPTPKPEPAPKPAPSNNGDGKKLANGFTVEHGTFINGNQPIQVRYLAGVDAPRAGMLPAGAKIKYDSFINYDGYVWVHYTGYNGVDLYLPTHPSGTTNNLWGTFK